MKKTSSSGSNTMYADYDNLTKKNKKVPEPFEYLGKVFKPLETLKGKWSDKVMKLWGNEESSKQLDCINKNGYNHSEFYKLARKSGCGNIDVFELDGEKVIPCNALMYYGEPTWYATKHRAELYEQTFRLYQMEYLKAEMKDIEEALFKKMESAFVSGSIPDEWKKTGNHLLKMAVIDSFCRDRPYKMRDSSNQKDANNIHLFI